MKSIRKNLVSIIIVMLSMIILVQYKSAIYIQLDNWKLIPRHERFTELYFDDHINLPKQIQEGEQISFSFVIHNLEGKRKTYPYVVSFKFSDGRIVKIDEGIITISDGGYKKITESYTSTLTENTGIISVELKDRQQNIDFLLNN